MKTTIDLPEDLVTELKLRATLEKRKIKEVAAEAIRVGLKEGPSPTDDAEIQRRLEILRNLKPVDEEQRTALADYLVEYREDRETFFDR